MDSPFSSNEVSLWEISTYNAGPHFSYLLLVETHQIHVKQLSSPETAASNNRLDLSGSLENSQEINMNLHTTSISSKSRAAICEKDQKKAAHTLREKLSSPWINHVSKLIPTLTKTTLKNFPSALRVAYHFSLIAFWPSLLAFFNTVL